jgi:hypothetical protein
MRSKRFFLACIIVMIVAETSVFAYTDPGSGTLILQMLIAAFVGLMFYIRRIISWVRRMTRGKAESLPDERRAEAEPSPSDPINADQSGSS